jgi:hypothetical protein
MPAGAEIYTSGGILHLSANLKNPVLRSKVTVATVANTLTQFGASLLVVPITRTSAPDDAPIIALQATDMVAYLGVDDPAALTQHHYYVSDLPVGTDVTCWLFGSPPAGTELYGLQLFNASGALTFHSQYKPLRIRAAETGAVPMNTTRDVIYDAGRTYGIVFPNFASGGIYQSKPNNTPEYASAAYPIANGIRVGSIHFQTSLGDTTPYVIDQLQLLAVDLTDY